MSARRTVIALRGAGADRGRLELDLPFDIFRYTDRINRSVGKLDHRFMVSRKLRMKIPAGKIPVNYVKIPDRSNDVASEWT